MTTNLPSTANQQIVVGNAALEADSNQRRGWFIGQFMNAADGLRQTKDVEVKWGTHPAGDEKTNYGINDTAITLSILISGSFILDFPKIDQVIELKQPGDYVIWAPGIAHTWRAPEASVVITVRWPSGVDDQRNISLFS